MFAILITALLHFDGRAPSLPWILDKHVEALGGLEKIHSIKSFIRHGWYSEGDHKGEATVIQMRPFYRYIGDLSRSMDEIHEGYDGSAWEYYPDPGLVVRTVGPAAAAARHGSLFDDPLVEPELHGTKLKFVDSRKIDGRSCYLLEVTLADGFREGAYVDTETFMIDAIERKVPMHAFGKRYQTHNAFSDYRPEGGVLYAHLVREIDGETGNILSESGIRDLEINPDLDTAIFSPPSWKRSLLQEMIQRIYDEREEVASVLGTYRDFGKMLDLTDRTVSDAVDFVGYQCLKMGHSETTVALLQENVKRNPQSSRAHFGLGRALVSSKKIAEGISEYKRALAINPNYSRAKAALEELAHKS